MTLLGYSLFRLCHGSSPAKPKYTNVKVKSAAFIITSDYGVTDAEPGKRGKCVKQRERHRKQDRERKRVVKKIKKGFRKEMADRGDKERSHAIPKIMNHIQPVLCPESSCAELSLSLCPAGELRDGVF